MKFIVGIESSDPWVQGKRRNQLREAADFYQQYPQRLANIAALGIRDIRFGLPYSQVHISENNYNFAFLDKALAEADRLQLNVIYDCLHFGLPQWLHQESQPFFQNPFFPQHFAQYCHILAKRYPQLTHFTIINEPLVTALFSAKYGLWNESIATHWRNDIPFVQAVKNIAKAAILGRQVIEQVWKEEARPGKPTFLQNESFELAIATHQTRTLEADLFNVRRFVPLDLIFGHNDPVTKGFLIANGMSEEEYAWFMQNGSKDQLLGIDHYPTCIHEYHRNGIRNHSAGDPCQLRFIIRQYYERYRMPMLHAEVNGWGDAGAEVVRKTYEALRELQSGGIPILGMTWYGDEYFVGWQHLLYGEKSLREKTLVGLYRDGELQPAGKAYAELIRSASEQKILV